jgi:hypothetical protein
MDELSQALSGLDLAQTKDLKDQITATEKDLHAAFQDPQVSQNWILFLQGKLDKLNKDLRDLRTLQAQEVTRRLAIHEEAETRRQTIHEEEETKRLAIQAETKRLELQLVHDSQDRKVTFQDEAIVRIFKALALGEQSSSARKRASEASHTQRYENAVQDLRVRPVTFENKPDPTNIKVLATGLGEIRQTTSEDGEDKSNQAVAMKAKIGPPSLLPGTLDVASELGMTSEVGNDKASKPWS